MFTDVGDKLKKVAKILFWVFAVVGVGGGVAAIIAGDLEPEFFLLGLVIAAVGIFASWIGALAIYGFGELVENSDIRTNLAIKQDMEKKNKPAA